MAGPNKKRLGNNPLSPYRALIRGGRSDIRVEEEALESPARRPLDPPPPAAAASAPVPEEPPAPAPERARPPRAAAPPPPPEPPRQVRTPKSWSPRRGAAVPRGTAVEEPAADEPIRTEPPVSTRYRSRKLAAAVTRRRDERGAEGSTRTGTGAERLPRGRPDRESPAAGTGTLDKAALELLERLLRERAQEQADEPPPRSPSGGRRRTPARDSAETLERTAADRLQRRRQKTVYLSDEACERLRELSFWMRLDQSTIVEEALVDFFEKHDTRHR